MTGSVAVRALVAASVACASVASCALFGFDDLQGGEPSNASDSGGGDSTSTLGDGGAGEGSAPVDCVGAAPQSWKPISPGPLPGRDEAAIFWTGSDYLVFGGTEWGTFGIPEALPDGAAPPFGDGGWPLGCQAYGSICSDGARYNPATDTWTPISNVGSPRVFRWDMSWAFGNGQLFTFGGHPGDAPGSGDPDNGGFLYDVASDTWKQATNVNAPTQRAYHASYFVKGEFFLWGGESLDLPDASAPLGTALSSGALYDPKLDTWTAINPSTAFAGTAYYATASSDTEFFVWGGTTDPAPWLSEVVDVTNTGAIYNYVTNSWKTVSTVNAPDPRRYAAAVWTGSKFVVWGGSGANGNFLYNTGGIYDPATDTWTATSMTNAPVGISPHTMVWNGKRVLIWGNPPALADGGYQFSGAIFNPETNSWDDPITQVNAPAFATNVGVGYQSTWNGTQMLQWGGAAYPDGGWGLPQRGRALHTALRTVSPRRLRVARLPRRLRVARLFSAW